MDLTKFLNGMQESISDLFACTDPKTGEAIKFHLKPGDKIYLFYKGSNGKMHCYTPHPDANGNYWCFTYQPIGKGSRSGRAHTWKVVDLVRCAKRKTAKAKALRRLKSAAEGVM